MTRSVSSAFFTRLQQDDASLAELIDLYLPNSVGFHWTTCNQELTYTLSGVPTQYVPFAGQADSGIEEDMKLGVSVMQFTLANTGSSIQNQLLSTDFALAGINIGRVFTDTPDLGRMQLYQGKVGDFGWTRHEITAQTRNIWKSLNIQWPYYKYQETCAWRFGSTGCGKSLASVTFSTSINVGSSTTTTLLLNSGTLTQSFHNGDMVFGRVKVTGGANAGAIRTIMAHTGDMIAFPNDLPNSDLTLMTIDASPGCKKHITRDCTSRFNNASNFFGFPWMITEGRQF